jgi:hypothetical protein
VVTAASAVDHHPRHNVHPGCLDGFCKARHDLLGDLVLWATVSRNLLVNGNRLGDTRAGDAFGFSLGKGLNLGCMLYGALKFSFTLVTLDSDAQF